MQSCAGFSAQCLGQPLTREPFSKSPAPSRYFVIPCSTDAPLGPWCPTWRGASGSACARDVFWKIVSLTSSWPPEIPSSPPRSPGGSTASSRSGSRGTSGRLRRIGMCCESPSRFPLGRGWCSPISRSSTAPNVAPLALGARGLLDAGVPPPEARTLSRGSRGQPDPLHRRGSRVCRRRASGGCRHPQIPPTGRCCGSPYAFSCDGSESHPEFASLTPTAGRLDHSLVLQPVCCVPGGRPACWGLPPEREWYHSSTSTISARGEAAVTSRTSPVPTGRAKLSRGVTLRRRGCALLDRPCIQSLTLRGAGAAFSRDERWGPSLTHLAQPQYCHSMYYKSRGQDQWEQDG